MPASNFRLTSFARLILLLVVALALAACGGSDASGPSDGPGPQEGEGGEQVTPSVEAVQARYGTLPLQERLSGTVRAKNQVAIYPEAAGPIVEVMAANGDQVQQGEPLVRLKARTSQDQLRQAEASLRAAEASAQQAQANLEELRGQLERTETLAEKGLVSQQTLETQRAQVASAEANYAQAQAQVEQAQAASQERAGVVGQTVVRAPVSGVVGQRNAEVGMMADGQTALFTIGKTDVVEVRVSITEQMISRLEVGQTALITSESFLGDTTVTAQLSRISPFLETGSYSAEAEIDVPNEEGLLKPGMFVTVDVQYGESQEATLVPLSALYENPETGAQGIYVASSLGEEVQVEATNPDEQEEPPPMTTPTPTTFREVEVLAEGSGVAGVRGVNDGAWVVVVGQQLLQAGEDGTPAQARVRPVTWNYIANLQDLQRQDLLRQFMEKQQRLARSSDSSGTAAAPVAERAAATSRSAL